MPKVIKKIYRLLSGGGGRYPYAFLITLLIIEAYGLIMLYSASYKSSYSTYGNANRVIIEQLGCTLLGWAAILVASNIDYHIFYRFSIPLYFINLFGLGAVLLFEPLNGCRRWIRIPGLPTIQWSEITKFILILFIAWMFCYYRKRHKTILHGIVFPIGAWLPIAVLMMMEPHLSGTILMALIVGVMMMFSGAGGIKLPIAIAGGAVLGITGVYLVGDRISYIQDRLDGWGLNKVWSYDLDGLPWQTQQSLYAIGSGGWTGTSLGNSIEKQLWLPECTNDFIFSVICEELGFFGAMAVIVLFAILVLQGVRIAAKAPDLYGSLIAIGIVGQIGCQTVLNIFVVTNTMPNTGISLPFFSSGGTSLAMLLAEIGVLCNIARQGNAAEDKLKEEAEAAQQTAETPQTPVVGRRRVTE